MSNRPNTPNRSSTRIRQARATADNRARTWWIVGAVVLVVAVVVAVAVAVGGSNSDTAGGGSSPSGGTVVPSGNLSTGDVSIQGTALPDAPKSGSGAPDTAIGLAAPGITGESFDGSPVVIANDGKPKVVMFVAHWCPHCQAEVPRIEQWLADNKLPTDVELYTVATSTSADRPNYPPGAWLRKESWPVPTLVDDSDSNAAKAYGLNAFPFFVVVDAQGNVVTRTSGELSTDQWVALLEAARTGQPPSATGNGQSSSAG